jgi:signal transduction histidine kinase
VSEDGSISITVEWEQSGHIRVDIFEQGYGAPQESIRQVMEQMRLEPTDDQKLSMSETIENGNQLSLSQVRYIIEDLHNGTINCEGHVGGGLKFTFRIQTII